MQLFTPNARRDGTRPAGGTAPEGAGRATGAPQRRAAVAALLFAAVPAAGCSSGPGMDEWAGQADAICAEINAEVDALADPGNDLASFGAYIEQVQGLLSEERLRLEALDQPDGDALPATMAEYLERQLSLLDELGTATAEGDAPRVRSLLDQSARELGPLGREVAEATGVEECATVGPVGGEARADEPTAPTSTTPAGDTTDPVALTEPTEPTPTSSPGEVDPPTSDEPVVG